MAKQKKEKKNTKKKIKRTRAKFLVYVDEGAASSVLVRFACSKAKIKNRPVEILFVIDPSEYNSLLGVGDVMKHDRRKEVEALLNKLAEEASALSSITPSINIREGDALEEIFKCIDGDPEINMLIISSSPSDSSGGKKLPGSIAEVLDERLHIPMMVVPATLTDDDIQELN